MKTKNITMLVAVAAICLLAASSVVSRQQPADKPDDSRFRAEMYKRLYLGQVTANLSMHSALIERMNQGDYKSVKGVLLADLKAGLERVGRETNYPWSEDQKKAQAMAEKCVKENEKK
jgi:hypothetical protein